MLRDCRLYAYATTRECKSPEGNRRRTTWTETMAHLDPRRNWRRFVVDDSIAFGLSVGALVRFPGLLRCLLVHFQIKGRSLHWRRNYHCANSKHHVLALSEAVRFDSL